MNRRMQPTGPMVGQEGWASWPSYPLSDDQAVGASAIRIDWRS